MDRKDLEALVDEQREKREPSAEVVRVDETHLQINGHGYELVTDVRQGFDLTAFSQRYSTILSKYDYIVGDWGFEQLRLKGFYAEDRAGAKQNQIEAVQDYLYESCNFGCAYFILHNQDAKPVQKPRRNRSRRRNNGNKETETREPAAKKTTQTTATTEKTTGNHRSGSSHRRRSRHSRHRNGNGNGTNGNHPFTEERRTTKPTAQKGKTVTVASGGQGRRHFTIRQKKED